MSSQCLLAFVCVCVCLSLRACVYVCVCVCERVSFVLSFYQKHTRQINQMSQWASLSSSCSLSHTETLACLICAYVCVFLLLSVCLCSAVAAAVNCRQFPRQRRPLFLFLLLLRHLTHCRQLCLCVCEAINLMIYWRLPQNLLLFFCCCCCFGNFFVLFFFFFFLVATRKNARATLNETVELVKRLNSYWNG